MSIPSLGHGGSVFLKQAFSRLFTGAVEASALLGKPKFVSREIYSSTHSNVTSVLYTPDQRGGWRGMSQTTL